MTNDTLFTFSRCRLSRSFCRLLCAILVSAPGALGQSSTLTTLYAFTGGNDGADPLAGVIIGTKGELYGTTWAGGDSAAGVVFQLTPPQSGGLPWTESTLHSFNFVADGGDPEAGVVLGTDGTISGTAPVGGPVGHGTVFQLAPPRNRGRALGIFYSLQLSGRHGWRRTRWRCYFWPRR